MCTFPSQRSSSIFDHYSPKRLHVTTKYLNYTVFKANEVILVPFLPVIAGSHLRTFWSPCISLTVSGRCGYWESCSGQWHPSLPQTVLELRVASAGDWCWERKQNLLQSVVLRSDKKEFAAKPGDPLVDTHSTRGIWVLGKAKHTLH